MSKHANANYFVGVRRPLADWLKSLFWINFHATFIVMTGARLLQTLWH